MLTIPPKKSSTRASQLPRPRMRPSLYTLYGPHLPWPRPVDFWPPHGHHRDPQCPGCCSCLQSRGRKPGRRKRNGHRRTGHAASRHTGICSPRRPFPPPHRPREIRDQTGPHRAHNSLLQHGAHPRPKYLSSRRAPGQHRDRPG